ncbi:uncharacterized protein PRCAT00000371001 [Priceomyces carsonii]|uniref:uncharacterized protein n=1 Tax=Priceomyces carsonii TaxID=28549 RepID=UPI002EDB6F2A|nr:unnamed protein product [Priceomyces carsonii]
MNTYSPPFKVRTKVSWPGEEEGDLGFMENEIVHVLAIVDESWWSGKLRRNGREGIFPKDYVEIIEDLLPKSTSSQSIATPKKLLSKAVINNEIVKANSSDSPFHKSYPNPSKPQLQVTNKRCGPNTSFNVEQSFDDSFNNLDPDQCTPKSKTPTPLKKKRYSADYVSPYNMSSDNMKDYNTHEDIIRQKENEIQYLKYLKQQNNSVINSIINQQKRALFHQQDVLNSAAGSPSLRVTTPKSSKHTSPYNNPDSAKSYSRKSLTTEDKLLPFRGSNSPLMKRDRFMELDPSFFSREVYPDSDDITLKRKQLEMELRRIKQLESSVQRKQRLHGLALSKHDKIEGDPSYDSGYISEDLISSKKNYFDSRDELSRKLTSYISDEENDGESGSPPPPPPPKHTAPVKAFHFYDQELNQETDRKSNRKCPYDADDFKISGHSEKRIAVSEDELLMLSQMQHEDLKNSIKSLQSDVLNLSELSATSAGSFMRHKYQKEQQQQEFRFKKLTLDEDEENSVGNNSQKSDLNKELMENMFQDKKARHPNIFKKLIQRKRDEDNVNPLEQKLSKDLEVNWTTLKSDLNRVNTLTSQDKQSRTKRVVREIGTLIVKPFDYVTEINTDEVTGEIDDDFPELDFSKLSFEKVDKFMSGYEISIDINELISDISVKFHSFQVFQIRAVLIHLCKFRIIQEPNKILQLKPRLGEILHKGEASIYQLNYLFKKILGALGIHSEVVLGFWKKPSEFYHDEQYVINHSWLSVLVSNRFMILDLLSFKKGTLCNIRNRKDGFNEFYFLCKPMSIISTHIPSNIELQHVVPPIDQCVAFHLPRLYSGFYNNRLKFMNFNNALTRLKDLEIFEVDLEIPVDVELFTLIKTAKTTTNESCLCQVKWVNNRRTAKIKAILPNGEKIGVLQVFAGPKGIQKYFDNIHELAIVVPIYHEGIQRDCKFVPRFPTVQSQDNDLYIEQPQVSKVIIKNSYNFQVYQYPSRDLNSGTGLMIQDFKLVIESPSGKYFKLNKQDPIVPYGLYEANIKCQEVGLYRGLVIGDTGNSWYVFTQWECVQGTVTN